MLLRNDQTSESPALLSNVLPGQAWSVDSHDCDRAFKIEHFGAGLTAHREGAAESNKVAARAG